MGAPKWGGPGSERVPEIVEHAPVARGKRVVCVTSGGNFDFARLPDWRECAALECVAFICIRAPHSNLLILHVREA